MKKKELEERIKILEEKIFFIEQKVCEHNDCEVIHTTEGHFRIDDYVGGDIYSLYCKKCKRKLGEVSHRWDTNWYTADKKILNSWIRKWGNPKCERDNQ